MGYSLNSRAYRIFNRKKLTVEENPHILFDESNHSLQINLSDDDLDARNTNKKKDDRHNFLSDTMSKNEEKDQKCPNYCISSVNDILHMF